MAAEYRIFNLQLKRRIQVSPSMLRCVFTGGDVAQMKHEAPDQRIKLLLGAQDGSSTPLSVSDSWYQDYLALPKSLRPVLRTYTLRALRAEENEVDIEFVLHGENGPASRWATHAQPGDFLQIVAPNAQARQDSGGYEWAAHTGLKQVLLIADETALPAAMGILEQLATWPEPPEVQAFFEVPWQSDVQPREMPFAQIHWLARAGHHTYGDVLLAAVRKYISIPAAVRVGAQSLEDKSLSNDFLWESAPRTSAFSAWIAAESTVVKKLRHLLIGEHQLDRETVNFMAYWTRGRG